MRKLYLITDCSNMGVYGITTSKNKASEIVNKLYTLQKEHKINDKHFAHTDFGINEAPLVNNMKEMKHAINNALIDDDDKHRLTDVGKSIFE